MIRSTNNWLIQSRLEFSTVVRVNYSFGPSRLVLQIKLANKDAQKVVMRFL